MVYVCVVFDKGFVFIVDKKGRMNPPKLNLHIAVESELWGEDFDLSVLCEVVLARAICFLTSKKDFSLEDIEVSFVFTDSNRIKELNAQYRGIDKPTNVLSFPSGLFSEYSGAMLGDIVLAYEVMEAEANVLGKKFKDHLVHLIIHGFLHLLRYDHVDDEDARLMEGLERSILADLGIDDPYELD